MLKVLTVSNWIILGVFTGYFCKAFSDQFFDSLAELLGGEHSGI